MLWRLLGGLPTYGAYHRQFMKQKTAASTGGRFMPLSLRHAFAWTLLLRNVRVSDVAEWLGHKSINVTFAAYGHLIESSLVRAAGVLYSEYTEWSQAA